MKDRPLVTVVIPTYSQEKTVGRAIDSVLAQQTDFPFEILIAEDGGSDGSRSLLMRYAARWPQIIRLNLRQRTAGASRNWYEALCDARGEFVCILKGDDWWTSSSKLQKQVDFLREHPDCLAVSHLQQLTDIAGDTFGILPDSSCLYNSYVSPEQFLKGHTFSCTPCLVRNFFDPDDEKTRAYLTANRMEAELPLCLLYLDRGPVFVMGEVLSARRVSRLRPGVPGSGLQTESSRLAVLLDVIGHSREYFGDKYDFDELLLSRTCGSFLDLARHGGLDPFLHQMGKLPLHLRLRFPFYTARCLCGQALDHLHKPDHR